MAFAVAPDEPATSYALSSVELKAVLAVPRSRTVPKLCNTAIDRDAAGLDPGLDGTARSQAGAGQDLLQALGGRIHRCAWIENLASGLAGDRRYYVYATKCAKVPKPADCKGSDPGVTGRQASDVAPFSAVPRTLLPHRARVQRPLLVVRHAMLRTLSV